MLVRTIKLVCTSCGQAFMHDLDVCPPHKAPCPYCSPDSDKRILPKAKKKKKKKRKRMLTSEERYPANADCPKPEFPQEWMLDFHCRSINEYHMSPHLRVRDKGAAYRALEAAGIGKVRRAEKKVRVTIFSLRQRKIDRQSLFGGSAKGLLDVLVRLGWVHDDTPDWCELYMGQEQVLKKDLDAGKERGTRVTIELAGDAD